jgi:type I restriction enzyme S subunit
MSRIGDLLAEHCPYGVEFVELVLCAAYSDTKVDAGELDETNFVGVDNLLQNAAGKVDAS